MRPMSGRPKTVNRVRNIKPSKAGNGRECPGHAAVAGDLFLDRFDPQPEPAQLAPPLILRACQRDSRSSSGFATFVSIVVP